MIFGKETNALFPEIRNKLDSGCISQSIAQGRSVDLKIPARVPDYSKHPRLHGRPSEDLSQASPRDFLTCPQGQELPVLRVFM